MLDTVNEIFHEKNFLRQKSVSSSKNISLFYLVFPIHIFFFFEDSWRKNNILDLSLKYFSLYINYDILVQRKVFFAYVYILRPRF